MCYRRGWIKTLWESPDRAATLLIVFAGQEFDTPGRGMNREERRRRQKLAAQKTKQGTNDDVQARLQVAIAHHQAGRLAEAESIYKDVLRADPANGAAYNNLGIAYKAHGKLDEANACYRRALKINPNDASAHANLANVLYDQGKVDDAFASYRRSLEINPDNADTHYNLGIALKGQGRIDEAIARCRRALEIKPSYFAAAWNAHLCLPILYDSEEDIRNHRSRWEAGIEKLDRLVDLESREGIFEAVKATTSSTNFFLHYQGMNDLALQKRYGALLHRVARAAYPDLAEPPAMRTIAPGEKIRVGFLSPHFFRHTIYKLFGHWITELNGDDFETHAFHTGKKSDQATRELKEKSDFLYAGLGSNQAAIHAIRSANLDILIYLDIGMDPNIQLLAALKLAPVQCMTWGHPVTSGLPTMDYFLTSDLMEPADGDGHYSEKLIRLPNLSIFYVPMDEGPPADGGRDEARGPDEVVYLCSQNLFKILPRFDEVCARIASRAPNARFRFIGHASPFVTDSFFKRLSRAFQGHGLDAGRFCTIHPKMSQSEFIAFTARADVFLDTIGWSGGNTTLETVALDVPVVTLPGPMMRSRHSYAILKMMGVEDTIARDIDGYVDIAVRLGVDPAWRQEIVGKMRTNKKTIYNDDQAIRGLEGFLNNACGRP